MNDQLFADEIIWLCETELAASIGRDPVSAGTLGDGGEPLEEVVGYPIHFVPGQSADSGARPLVIIHGEYQSYPAGYRRGKLHIMFRSNFGDEDTDPLPPPEYTHRRRFESIYAFFLGEPLGGINPKTTVRELVTARGNVEMLDYGPDPDTSIEATDDGQELVSTLHLRVAFRHLPV